MHKKDMIQMIAAITLIIVVFYVAQAYLFPPAATPPKQNTPAGNQAAANAPASNTAADPQKEPQAKPPELRSTGPAAGMTTVATRPEAEFGYDPIAREAAVKHELANSRMTATFSERGAMLDSLAFIDQGGNTVSWRTPDDPTIEPFEPLELLRWNENAPSVAPLALTLDANDELRNTSRWQLHLDERGNPGETQSLTFRFPPADSTAGRESDGTVIFKKLTLHPDSFRIDVEVTFENHSSSVREKIAGLWGPVGITNDGMKGAAEFSRVALYGSTESKRFADLEDWPTAAYIGSEARERLNELGITDRPWITNREFDEIDQADRFLIAHGLRTQYFLAFLAHDPNVRDPRISGTILPVGEVGGTAALSLVAPPLAVPAAGDEPGRQAMRMSLYAGPRDKDMLGAAWRVNPPQDPQIGEQWLELATSGFFDLIASPLIWFLRILTNLVGPGLAIILLTLFVRFALSPLSYRGQKAMATYTQKMKVVKPKLDAIKEKYKGKTDRDTQLKMLNETRAAMKEQNVGMLPLGGCLPMLIQLPIFIGLYRAFGAAFFLRQAEFLWIHDLSLPDATLPVSTYIGDTFLLSFLAHNGFLTLNILPILWIVLSIVQFKMQPKPDDPQQAAMQRQMGCIFPIMGLLFYGFASGFALYFIVSSVYSIAESKLIKHNLIKQGVMPPPKKKSDVKDGEKPAYHAAK